jgi:Rrf2 family protein
MFELALNNGKGPVKTRFIAQRQGISFKYLEQLMTILRSAGFIRSIRGSKGGYMLAKAPNEIKLSDVFDCLEGPVTTVECLEDKNYCERVSDCMVRQVWAQVQGAITNVLQSITLQDLVESSKDKSKFTYQI